MYCVKCGKLLDDLEERCGSCSALAVRYAPGKNSFFSGIGLKKDYSLFLFFLILLENLLIFPVCYWGLYEGSPVKLQHIMIGEGIFMGGLFLIAVIRIFRKAGKHGWEFFVPFYNLYCIFDIADDDARILVHPLLLAFLALALFLMDVKKPFLWGVLLIGGIYTFILYIILIHNVAERFRYGFFYLVLLIPFLPILFLGWSGHLAGAAEDERKKKRRKRNVILFYVLLLLLFLAGCVNVFYFKRNLMEVLQIPGQK